MERSIHVFDNGVKVYDDQLLPVQRDRYENRNVHEAEEEDLFLEIVRGIPGNGCYVNIGTAIGYYPLLAKMMAPELTVHAIEPLERHRASFIENMGLNGLDQSNFVIHDEGVSSQNGEAVFIDKGFGSSLRKNPGSKNPKSVMKHYYEAFLTRTGFREPRARQTITTKTLDNLCREIGGSIDLCQMDVQGFELEVLDGARESLRTGIIKTLLLGTHSQQLHDDCIDILMEHGYAIEHNNPETKDQPDGIIVASKGCKRLHKT